MKKQKVEVIHYPRLDTILMVENAIKKSGEYPNKMQLWKSLPKKIMYQTFKIILNYLESSGKIVIDKDGSVLWTHNPKLLEMSVKS
ncbi:hypothetical protein HYV79_00045 [Candidatus Woesearchaeota archaeon]|nr:hypothetical protein [Candidatus Woesearchaeota archaeon]